MLRSRRPSNLRHAPALHIVVAGATIGFAFVACSSGGQTATTATTTTAGTPQGALVGSVTSALIAPQFPGMGTGFAGAPLQPGVSATSAGLCSAPLASSGAPFNGTGQTICYYGATPTPTVPAATVEQILETALDATALHLRITFNPDFVDNSYGDNAIGWGSTAAAAAPTGPGGEGGPGGAGGPGGPGKGGHTFKDLVESDHVELKLTDAQGVLRFDMNVDYISADSTAPCGYGTLGVRGGEGKMVSGDAGDVLGVATSLSRDLNGCGYCLTDSSPATDSGYTPNPTYPKWDYRVVYEVWVNAKAFGAAGFGAASLELVHASPSKLSSPNLPVEPGPCPPTWTTPCCTITPGGEGLTCAPNGTPTVDAGTVDTGTAESPR